MGALGSRSAQLVPDDTDGHYDGIVHRRRRSTQCSHPETDGEPWGGVCQTAPVLSFAMIIGSRRAGPQ
ncbi:hypothetical protein [Streptomyces sp. AC550_RSS872]|uniref:hypothetical protein n=1 Tax=Streptomyces sp. AC550_RSS872 TaxID=2823689 RepID=UPI001C268C83|nr:hypothetical protein [Streptomyces sp. AC550_RSS872]